MDADVENQFTPPISTPSVELSSIRNVRSVTDTSGAIVAAAATATAATATAATATTTAATTATTTATTTTTTTAATTTAKITRKKLLCFRKNINKIDELINIVLLLPTLSDLDKITIRIRYIELLITFNKRCLYYSILFRVLRIIVTVGSLLVPALLSVQYDDKYKTDMYWATWVISLAVTTSNGIFTLFKIDKKYYFLHTIKELLVSEGWQYIALTGRYGTGGHLPLEGGKRTHSALFPYFCHYIEKIKLKQIEEEYYKGIESNQTQSYINASSQQQQQQQQQHVIQAASKLYQITPDKNIAQTEKKVEETTKVQVNHFLNNMAQAQAQQQQQQQQQQQTRSPSPIK